MKTNISQGKPSHKGFYEFTFFSVFAVSPGTVLTPAKSVGRSPIGSLRKRDRSQQQGWNATTRIYTIQREQIQKPVKTEEDEWAAGSRRARLSWMDENPY